MNITLIKSNPDFQLTIDPVSFLEVRLTKKDLSLNKWVPRVALDSIILFYFFEYFVSITRKALVSTISNLNHFTMKGMVMNMS